MSQELRLVDERTLECSPVVANCRMNRERQLRGNNGYSKELGFDPLDYLLSKVDIHSDEPIRWLDLCCGTGTALIEAADICEAEARPVEIIGLDLVNHFRPHNFDQLTLAQGSIHAWKPSFRFDLITCVHGLHYVGDKLSAIEKAISWLAPEGSCWAHLDLLNVCISGKAQPRKLARLMRAFGFDYSFRTHLLHFREGAIHQELPLRFLGADPNSGPNYTGQAAVDSHYEAIAGW